MALKTNQGQILTRKNEKQQEHNRFILPAVDGLLAEAGMRLQDLDYLSAGRGPGSFVGTRLAVAVIQGLAFGVQKPVVGTSHLALMALASGAEVITLDAKMQGYYQAHFKAGMPVGQEQFHRFAEGKPPVFNPLLPLRGEDLIVLAEREVRTDRIFKDPSLLQPVYLHDEGNWKKQ